MFKFIKKLKLLFRKLGSYEQRLLDIQTTLGRIEQRQNLEKSSSIFNKNEFKVFSQWGEDGLIQYLLRFIHIENPIFVEFGVQNYLESNTRFLLVNNNWSGLVIDGDPENISYIKSSPIYWRHDLKAECAFITKDNINELLTSNGLKNDIGLLSVDIDGNDYWVWNAIDVISPRIVVCEYNSLWGDTLSVTTPYLASFSRTKEHYSNLYFGASITALTDLAKSKGYSLVGSNTAGNNIFFVRNDLLGGLVVLSPQNAWIESRFRESINKSGNLSFLSVDERLALVSDMPLVNLNDGQHYPVNELYSIKAV